MMSKVSKRMATALLAAMVALSLSFPALSFAAPEGGSSSSTTAESAQGADGQAAADCTVTLKYYENVTYEEPGIPAGADGRYLLGSRTLTGLQEGEVLDTWDYVADIPGFFFFDAWPASLTVSADPAQNEISLFYGRLWNAEYTVNYYLMEGADWTADNWGDALATGEVEFIKLGSETFENQPYGKLVEGDAYEYKVDGMYAIDAYPPEIRAGTDTDNDVINVLYAPNTTKLPDSIEIPEEVVTPPATDSGNGSGTVTVPPDQSFDKDEITAILPGVSGSGSVEGSDTAGSDANGAQAALPDGMTQQQADELFQDFVGTPADTGTLQITDEMLEHPQSKQEADKVLAAYNTGLEEGTGIGLQQADHGFAHWFCIIVAIILAILAIIGFSLFGREHHRLRKLEGAQDGQAPQQPNGPVA